MANLSPIKSRINKTNEWLTPPEIFRVLGEFDLDPCAPVYRPWPTAREHFTIKDNGLLLPWAGRVWLNPPYDNLEPWLKRMALHGNGISLTFNKSDINAIQDWVYPFADSMLLIRQRLNFYTVAGTRSKYDGGAPSVLFAYGEMNMDKLAESGIRGRHIPLNSATVIVVGISPTWRSVVKIAMVRLYGESHLEDIYNIVETIAPDKKEKNVNYKAKIRQTLQKYFDRTGRGYYSIPKN